MPITSAEPAHFGVCAEDSLSRWRALREFRKTLEGDHESRPGRLMGDLWELCDRKRPLGHKWPACILLFVFLSVGGGGALLFTASPRTRKEFLSRQSLLWLRGRTVGALCAERHILTSPEWTSCSACHELLCSRAFLYIVLQSAQHP